MQIDQNWAEIKQLFKQAFKSSFHYAIATVNENGDPHVTPIGSLILSKPGHGLYFEKFPKHLPQNLETNNKICVLAVNSSRWFWIKSLVAGKFASPPAIRLYGTVGTRQKATEKEIKLWQLMVKRARFTKGHAMIWADMAMVRHIEFTHAEPVQIGKMTYTV